MSDSAIKCVPRLCVWKSLWLELHPIKGNQRWQKTHKLPVTPITAHQHPGRGKRILWDGSLLSSLSLPPISWPLTGPADVRAASGTRLSLLFLAVSFPLAPSSHRNGFWLISKLLQHFVGVTFAEADWQTGPGAHSFGGVSGVSVWRWQRRRGWKDNLSCDCGCPAERTVYWRRSQRLRLSQVHASLLNSEISFYRTQGNETDQEKTKLLLL